MTEIKPQEEFPLLEKYREVFEIDKNTIFAYDNTIYANGPLPEHLIIHEETHLKQQNEIGLEKWVKLYFKNNNFRLNQEVEAYRNQLDSIKDRNKKARIRISCAKDLSSSLYGDIIDYKTAYRLLNNYKNKK